MLSQQNLTVTAFAQLFENGILPETTGRVEILTLRGVDSGLVFDVIEIVFEVLASFSIKEAERGPAKQLGDIRELVLPLGEVKVGQEVAFCGGILVEVDLNEATITFLSLGLGGSTSSILNCILIIMLLLRVDGIG